MNGYANASIATTALSQGERVLWNGAPVSGIYVRPADFMIAGFVGLVAVVTAVWSHQSHASEAGVDAVRLLAMFAVVVGLAAVNIVLVAPWLRSRITYVLTDQRIVIVLRSWTMRTESIQLRALLDVVLEERRSGLGTIRFLTAGMPMAGPAMARSRFDLIAEPRTVYSLIRTAQTAAVRIPA